MTVRSNSVTDRNVTKCTLKVTSFIRIETPRFNMFVKIIQVIAIKNINSKNNARPRSFHDTLKCVLNKNSYSRLKCNV